MEVVDSQVHANQIAPNWKSKDHPGLLDASLAAMEAAGVSALVIHEYTGADDNGNILPGHVGPGGSWRSDNSFGPYAVEHEPSRFTYIGRVDPFDPDLEDLFAQLGAAPGCVALRASGPPIVGTWHNEPLENGEYDRYFAVAEATATPVFVRAPGRPEVLVPYLERFPGLILIVDHCGIAFPKSGEDPPDRYSRFDAVLELARFPNVALKWAHIERWSAKGYPFADIVPQLHRAIESFGAKRIMWASDFTQMRRVDYRSRSCSWADTLHYIFDEPTISTDDKEWILGRTARTILGWPATT